MGTSIKLKQLKILLNDFELLSRTALTQLRIASKLMKDNTTETLYEEIETNENIIDRLEITIREEAVYAIFQFTPKASDLRLIITYQEITTNLERVGDMVLNIVHLLKEIHLDLPRFVEFKELLQKMLDYASDMIHHAISSFSNGDAQAAYGVIKKDDEVDELFFQINKLLETSLQGIALNRDEIANVIGINSISQNLERIGDSATNIAEATIYLTEGKDIRHGNED